MPKPKRKHKAAFLGQGMFLLKMVLILAITISISAGLLTAAEIRLKDLVNVRGVRSNQLIGLGVVIGLKNTGDSKKSLTTNRAVATMLTKLGMTTLSDEIVTGSVAAVIATADLPAFARIGDHVDIRVSTVGDAKSLAGGTLILTPLRAGDGKVYLMAQGPTIVGQANGAGAKVLTVATVPNGGMVEKEFKPAIADAGIITLSLRNPDFTTNARLTDAINTHLRGFYAKSLDPASIAVQIPTTFQDQTVEFIAELEKLAVQVDHKAVVVLNERTGTIVMGSDVTIGPVTVSHGDLSIQIGTKGKSSGKGGKTEKQGVVNFKEATVGELVETMNALGVKPEDLVGILQAVFAAGALHAELKTI